MKKLKLKITSLWLWFWLYNYNSSEINWNRDYNSDIRPQTTCDLRAGAISGFLYFIFSLGYILVESIIWKEFMITIKKKAALLLSLLIYFMYYLLIVMSNILWYNLKQVSLEDLQYNFITVILLPLSIISIVILIMYGILTIGEYISNNTKEINFNKIVKLKNIKFIKENSWFTKFKDIMSNKFCAKIEWEE